jgi:hypothetical protein
MTSDFKLPLRLSQKEVGSSLGTIASIFFYVISLARLQDVHFAFQSH